MAADQGSFTLSAAAAVLIYVSILRLIWPLYAELQGSGVMQSTLAETGALGATIALSGVLPSDIEDSGDNQSDLVYRGDPTSHYG